MRTWLASAERRRFAALILVLASIIASRLAPVLVAADEPWQASYDTAMKAIKARNWSLAEQKLRAALAARDAPKPGRRVRYFGTRFDQFLPEYYLAVAYVNEGKYREADELFKKVEHDGLITSRDPEFQELSTLVRKAQDGMALLAANNSAINQQNGVRQEAESGRNTGGTARGSAQPSVGGVNREAGDVQRDRRARFDALMAQASGALASRQYGAARKSAEEARDIAVDNQRVSDFLRSIDTAEALQNSRDAVAQRRWLDARRSAQRVLELSPSNNEARAIDAQAAKSIANEDLERNALKAFYVGDYVRSVALFERVVKEASNPSRAYFYLACSNAALGLLAGSYGADHITLARRQFARTRGADTVVAVDRQFISPRILQLLDKPAASPLPARE